MEKTVKVRSSSLQILFHRYKYYSNSNNLICSFLQNLYKNIYNGFNLKHNVENYTRVRTLKSNYNIIVKVMKKIVSQSKKYFQSMRNSESVRKYYYFNLYSYFIKQLLSVQQQETFQPPPC